MIIFTNQAFSLPEFPLLPFYLIAMRGDSLFLKYKKTIESCELFKGMDSHHLVDFFSNFHEEKWPKKSCLLNNEKFYNHFYFILKGRIKMYQVNPQTGKELTLFILSKNDIIDLFCLLDGCKHEVFYECIDQVWILSSPIARVKSWLNKNPKYYRQFLPYAGKHLRILENYLSDITFKDIPSRILNLLIKNFNQQSNSLEFINDFSNKEIAYLIGSTRAVVNRHLQKLKQNGSINISRNKLEILDLPLLLKLLESQQ